MGIDWRHPTDTDVPHKQGLISRHPLCVSNVYYYIIIKLLLDWVGVAVSILREALEIQN